MLQPVTKSQVTELFRRLRKKGFFARQNYWCCGGCAMSAAHIDMKPDKHVACVLYHGQDNDAWADPSALGFYGRSEKILSRRLLLRYDHEERNPSGIESQTATGEIIAAEAREMGLTVDWDGNGSTTIKIVPHCFMTARKARQKQEWLAADGIEVEVVVNDDASAYLAVTPEQAANLRENVYGYAWAVYTDLEDGRVAVEIN